MEWPASPQVFFSSLIQKECYMKSVELTHLFFKAGDDMAHHVKTTASAADALEAFAGQMDYAAQHLRAVKDIVAGHPVTIQADCHFITIEGPDEVIDKLVMEELADEVEDEEDED
jgi:hypothetical protein